MRILADRHHMGLTESLRLLFEKRLGHELYFQKGMEWYPEFWNVYPHIDTAKQYLERELEGVNGITLEEFKNSKFDILIASIPQHIEPFRKLISQYQPQAKLIFQIGNAWNIDSHQASLIDGVMASAKVPMQNVNGHNGKPLLMIEYHQEASPQFQYVKKENLPSKNIYSFMNIPQKFPDWPLFLDLEQKMQDWNFKAFGGQARDGAIWDRAELAGKMREAMFIFHLKAGGDGMGHVIHDSFQVGTPPIVKREYYLGTLAETLMIDGKTCITTDNKSIDIILKEISHYSQPENYFAMSINAANRFKEIVDYDKEEDLIRRFLENI